MDDTEKPSEVTSTPPVILESDNIDQVPDTNVEVVNVVNLSPIDPESDLSPPLVSISIQEPSVPQILQTSDDFEQSVSISQFQYRHSTPTGPTGQLQGVELAQRPASALPPPKRSLKEFISRKLKLGTLLPVDNNATDDPGGQSAAVGKSSLPTGNGEHQVGGFTNTGDFVVPTDPKARMLLNLTLKLMTPKKKLPPPIHAVKSSTALSANFGSSFVVERGENVETHIQDYALPSNLHLDFKPTLAGSNVMSREGRNGLMGRRVADVTGPPSGGGMGSNIGSTLKLNTAGGFLASTNKLASSYMLATTDTSISEKGESRSGSRSNLKSNKGSVLNLASRKGSAMDLATHRGSALNLAGQSRASRANLASSQGSKFNLANSLDSGKKNLDGSRKNLTNDNGRAQEYATEIEEDSSSVPFDAGRRNSRGSYRPNLPIPRRGSLNAPTVNGRESIPYRMVSTVGEELPGLATPAALGMAVDSFDVEPDWHARKTSTSTTDTTDEFGKKGKKVNRSLPSPTKKVLETEVPFFEDTSVSEFENDAVHLANNNLGLEGERPHEQVDEAKLKAFVEQLERFNSQQPRPSFIPRPTSKQHPREQERVEIVPLSLVEQKEPLEVIPNNEATSSTTEFKADEVNVTDIPFPAYQADVIDEATTNPIPRPQTVPDRKSTKKSQATRLSQSAKPTIPIKPYPHPKFKKAPIIQSSPDGKRITVLTRDGFGTGAQNRKLTNGEDPVAALLSTHREARKYSMSTNEIVITPGPILPNLEARPITSYLKNRIKDPIALNMEAHASIRQFNADNNISCYSQPLPITRYIPNSQKKPNKHVAKLRDLRAQHEFKIQEEWLGTPAIAPKWFMRHAEQVVGDRVERGLLFGGEVQGLNPSFSAIRPGHEVFGRLGRVHLVSEYRTGTDGGDEGILQDGVRREEGFCGETRRMLDGLLKKNRIYRLGGKEDQAVFGVGLQTATNTLNPQQFVPITQNIGLLNVNLKEERKVSLGGGFIYTKNKPPRSETSNDSNRSTTVKSKRSRYAENLVVEAFSVQ